jgi:hypothetical protein
MIYSVYISSTYIDLIEDRGLLRARLDQAGLNTVCMEKYPPAFSEDVKIKCEKDVVDADIYVCIIGDKYGSIARDKEGVELGYSYTEFEYDTAVKNYKRRLVFFKKNLEIEDSRLKTFISKIRTSPKGYAEFSEIAELPALVLASIMVETGGNEKKNIPESIKYLCDRSEQSHGFTTSLIRDEKCPVHFFFVNGHRRNGHAILVNRCILTLKSMFDGRETLDIIVLAQCSPAINEERVLTYIKQKIISQLEGKTNQFGIEFSAASFFKCLEIKKAHCLIIRIVIQGTTLLQNNDIYMRSLERFCSTFLKSNNGGASDQKIIFFIHIEYEEIVNNEKEVVMSFSNSGSFVHMCLPELTKIGETDVREWLMQYNIENNQANIDRLYADHFSDIKKDNENLFFMDDAEMSLQEIINIYNKTKLHV